MQRQQYFEQHQTNQNYIINSSKRSNNHSQIQHLGFKTQKKKVQPSGCKLKSAQFHKQIVRHKKQQKFTKLRQSNHINHIQLQMDKLMAQLDTRNKRIDFIQTVIQKLQGQPNNSWKVDINHLLMSLKCFYMNGEMHRWIESGIIDKLCEIFDNRYREQSIWSKGAYLLEKIIFLQPLSLQHVMKYQQKSKVIENIYECSLQEQASLTQVSNCIQLLTTMISISNKQVLTAIGILQSIKHCTRWLQRITKQTRSQDKAIRKVYKYIIELSKYINKSQNQLSPQCRYQVKKMLSIMNEIVLFSNQSQQNHQKLITIVYNLTLLIVNSNSTSQEYYSINLPICVFLAEQENILNKIIQLTPKQFNQTVNAVIAILKYTSQTNSQPIELHYMIKQYLLQYKQNNNQIYNKRATYSTIPIIDNFISYFFIVFKNNPTALKIIQSITKFFKIMIQKLIKQKKLPISLTLFIHNYHKHIKI